MSATNVVAQHVESHGVRTYSTKEMAFNILVFMRWDSESWGEYLGLASVVIG